MRWCYQEHEMKPVAYMARCYEAYFDGTHPYIPMAVEVSLINFGWKDQIELYTGEQLRAVQVEGLREAAEQWVYAPGEDAYGFLRRMANELESTELNQHNPDEAADTPRTPR